MIPTVKPLAAPKVSTAPMVKTTTAMPHRLDVAGLSRVFK